MIEAAILVIFPFAMVYSAVSDLLSMSIANRVSLMLVASFVILAPLAGFGWDVIGWHLLAGFLMLAISFALWSIGQMGGGDAKLIAGTSVWLGFGFELLHYAVAASFFGGVLTILVLLFRASPIAVYAGQVEFLRRIGDKDKGIPYGIALGIAGLAIFPQSLLGEWVIARIAGS